MSNPTNNLFISAGLSNEQAKVYDILLKNSSLPANKISRICLIERSFTYKILNQLVSLKLAQKNEANSKIAMFTANHPHRLLELAAEKQRDAENSYRQLETGIGEIISTYNLTVGKPSIIFTEGLTGLKKMHDDIIQEGKDIKLFRSTLDKLNPESKKLIEKQRDIRVPRRLKTFIIGPLPTPNDPENGLDIDELKKEDADRLVERRVIDNFDISAQILIYGNKVAITDYKNNIITTIIENESVKNTFEKIFDHIFILSRKL